MKIIFLLILLPFMQQAHAQEADWQQGEPLGPDKKPSTTLTPRYRRVTGPSDSGFITRVYYSPEGTLESATYFEDEDLRVKHGPYRSFYPEGSLKQWGSYEHGTPAGIWVSRNRQGQLADSSRYEQGRLIGIRLLYSPRGTLADSSVFDGQGNGSSIGIYPEGTKSYMGTWKDDSVHTGTWTFYDRQQRLLATDEYNDSGRLTRSTCYDSAGNALQSGCGEVEAEFPGGASAWQTFMQKRLDPTVPITKGAPGGTYLVMVEFVVDGDGAVTRIVPLTAYGYGMEEEVIRVLRASPRWNPATRHNQVVNAIRRQPITYFVEEIRRKRRNKD